MYGLIQAYADSDTAIEESFLKVRGMQEEYSDSIEVDIMYNFRKHDSDVPEVIMKRRQQDAQAKAAKHYSAKKRLSHQEAQAIYGS